MNVWACSRLRWQAHNIPDSKGSYPGLFYCFDRWSGGESAALPEYKSTAARRVGLLSRSCVCRYPGLLRAEDKANNTIFLEVKG